MDCGPNFPTAEADACTLSARLEALRAFARGVAETVQSLQLPETYLEAERAVRAIQVADRLMANLREETLGDEEGLEEDSPSQQAGAEKEEKQNTPPPPKMAVPLPIEDDGAEKESEEEVPPPSWTSHDTSPCDGEEKVPTLLSETRRARLRLRAYADRVMEAVTFIPKPDNFLEGERAGRYALAAERMLMQLYVRPVPKTSAASAPHLDPHDEDEDEYTEDGRKIFRPRSKGVDPTDMRAVWADWQFELEEKLLAQSARKFKEARETGFFRDGTPYNPAPAPSPETPIRYNPDGTEYCNREEVEASIAARKAAEAAEVTDAETEP